MQHINNYIFNNQYYHHKTHLNIYIHLQYPIYLMCLCMSDSLYHQLYKFYKDIYMVNRDYQFQNNLSNKYKKEQELYLLLNYKLYKQQHHYNFNKGNYKLYKYLLRYLCNIRLYIWYNLQNLVQNKYLNKGYHIINKQMMNLNNTQLYINKMVQLFLMWVFNKLNNLKG